MRHRCGRILLLAFTIAWFGAIVPGHQRGVIVLGSSGRTQTSDGNAEPSCDKCRHSNPESKQNDSPAPRRAPCAICHFASTIEPPPPALVIPRPTASLNVESWDAPRGAVVHIPFWFDARGPPA